MRCILTCILPQKQESSPERGGFLFLIIPPWEYMWDCEKIVFSSAGGERVFCFIPLQTRRMLLITNYSLSVIHYSLLIIN